MLKNRFGQFDSRSEKERQYDNINNEGGEGYNPYRAERQQKEAEDARRQHIEDMKRPTYEREQITEKLAYIDWNDPMNKERVDSLRARAAELDIIINENKFKQLMESGWTPEVTQQRREKWNAAIEAGEATGRDGKVDMFKLKALRSKMGFTESQLKEAVEFWKEYKPPEKSNKEQSSVTLPGLKEMFNKVSNILNEKRVILKTARANMDGSDEKNKAFNHAKDEYNKILNAYSVLEASIKDAEDMDEKSFNEAYGKMTINKFIAEVGLTDETPIRSSVAPGVTAGGLSSKSPEIKQLPSTKPVLALPQPNVIRIESQRSKRSQGADESRAHSLIINQSDSRLNKWVRDPGSMDVLGVDTPPNISQTTERISKRESHITRRSGSLGSKMPRISQRTPRIK